MECQFCKKNFSSISSLNNHKITAKYCLKIQGNIISKYECEFCNKNFTKKSGLKTHLISCKEKKSKNEDIKDSTIDNLKKEIQILRKDKDEEINNLRKDKDDKNLFIYKLDTKLKLITEKTKEQIDNYKEQIEEYKEQIHQLQDRLERMGTKAIEKTLNTQNLFEIEIEDIYNNFYKNDISIKNEEQNEDEIYQLTPLELENGFVVEYRNQDGYIDITNLCKAGKRYFKHWNETCRSKAFLEVLSSTVGIPTVELIKYEAGGNGKRHTWVHPQVAINVSQWISPNFDVKVSSWIFEIMVTGKVDIRNTKSYNELQKENKNKELRIKFLTNKYVKKQNRIQYENDNNVIYILTTENLKKERIYVFGKAKSLKSRLSTYNKSEEHEVIYYQQCKDEEIMSCIENMIFKKLENHRQQANRERFILPNNKEISYFIETIKESINFF